MSTIFINSFWQSEWTPADPTTDGGVSPLVWEVPGVANFQDVAKTTPSGIGDIVKAAVNQGSDTHDIVQATTDNAPTLQQVTINGVTSYVWRFDGINDYLQGAFSGGAISQPFTVFAVATLDAAAVADANNYFITGGVTTTGRMVLDKVGAGTMRMFAGNQLFGDAPTSNPTIWTALYNVSNSILWENGVADAGPGLVGSQTPTGITVGNRKEGDFSWKGDIGQILIYPGNISTADKNQVNAYLERVTGITVATIT